MYSKVFLSLFLFFNLLALAQNKKPSEQQIELPTYGFEDPNPMPALAFNPKIYPYHIFEGYSTDKTPQAFRNVRLENRFINVEILPDVGGKVWGAIDKSNGNEFVYKNEVLKFRDIAMRGPWTSGGIEFNFGIIGHHPGTAAPVDYTLETLANGTQVCVVGTIDLPSRTQWRVRIELEPNKSAFSTQATWYNPTQTQKAYYNWMTAAAEAKKDLVFATPGNAYLQHDGTALPWPQDGLNRNISRYEENNFGSSKSYHVVGTYNDFFGGYYEEDQVGFGHWGRYDEIPGQKLWLWDLSRFGGIWEDLLTDSDGQYIEYQAGRLFVQYYPGAENPITQATFEPHQTDHWTEVWFPLKKTRGLSEASSLGALHVAQNNTAIDVFVNPFITKQGQIVFEQGEKKQEQDFDFKANEAHSIRFTTPHPESPFKVEIKALELDYDSKPKRLKRPFVTPKKFQGFESNTILYQKGLDAQRYRDFDKAESNFHTVLEKDAAHLDARVALGSLLFDNGQYNQALEVIQLGLGLDTYHPGLNYAAGINYLALSDYTNAKESLGWAARSSQYRSAAYAQMSQIALLEKKFAEALHYANQAQLYNTQNITAICYNYFALKALNKKEEAQKALLEIKTIDPLHHLPSFEAYLENEITAVQLLNYHRSEFPYQTFLELALLYHNAGFTKTAIKVLEAGPKHMLNALWLAYLSQESTTLASVFNTSVDFVFPFRRESIPMFQWVTKESNHWKGSYLLALNWMALNQKKKGKNILQSLGNRPNTANFYWIRSQLTSNNQKKAVFVDLERSYQMDPKNWRIALDYAAHFESTKNWTVALKTLKKINKEHPQNFRIGLRLANALNNINQFEKAVALLDNLYVLPYEHATGSRGIYTNAFWGSALNAIQKEDWKEASQLLFKALEWPERLGVGKPFNPEERLTLMLMAFAEQQQNNYTNEALNKIVAYSKKHLNKGGKNCLIGLYAIQFLEGESAAKQYANQLHQVGAKDPSIQQALQFYFAHPATELTLPLLKSLVTFIQ
jgi:predicted Zn-dependent protease